MISILYPIVIIFLLVAHYQPFIQDWVSVVPKQSTSPQDSVITSNVDLLLYKIIASDSYSKRYLKEIKFLMMQYQLYNPKINLVNKESPSFYLSLFKDDKYWPGGRQLKNSDYSLNIKISRHDKSNKIYFTLSILDNMSRKLTYRYSTVIDPLNLSRSIENVSRKISDVFNIKSNNCYSPKVNLAQLTKAPHLNSLEMVIKKGYASIDEVNYLTPFVLSDPSIKDTLIQQWINVLESSNSIFQRDIDVWLSLLFYRIRDFDNSERYFIRSDSLKMIDNSFLYLVRSDVQLYLRDESMFLEYYMKSLVTLTNLVPAKYVYHRISNLRNFEECLSPWKELDLVLKLDRIDSYWTDSFSSYCMRSSSYLENEKKTI